MRILLLGTGLQGRAALHDLAQSAEVSSVVAADRDIDGLTSFLAELGSAKIQPVKLDASDLDQVARLMRAADAAIVLLPPAQTVPTAAVAVAQGCHWLDASYAVPAYQQLHEAAQDRGVALLPEFGLDPGIDLLLTAAALAELDQVEALDSYGSGIPEWEAIDNPLNYKVSWSLAAVLRAYRRPARVLAGGKEIDIAGSQIFAQSNIHLIDIPGVGRLEACPNGDAVKYVEQLGLSGKVVSAGRYSMRWPGHAALWHSLSALGFLDEAGIPVAGRTVAPVAFLEALLAPRLQYQRHERDLAIVRVEATGWKDGQRQRICYQVVDRRDLDTGLMAMQRTVGYTISIGAQMIVRGDIKGRGLLSPLRDVPLEIAFNELKRRGIEFSREVVNLPAG